MWLAFYGFGGVLIKNHIVVRFYDMQVEQSTIKISIENCRVTCYNSWQTTSCIQ